jgi:hypothetical protein
LKSIRSFSSAEGEPISSGATYELAVDYDNTSGEAQDSMASLGMFVGADGWTRPRWAARGQNPTAMDASCGLDR